MYCSHFCRLKLQKDVLNLLNKKNYNQITEGVHFLKEMMRAEAAKANDEDSLQSIYIMHAGF